MAQTWSRLAIYFGLKDDPDSPPNPAEMRASARTLLRTPSWWLALLGVGLCIGAAYEGIAAVLGDGEFNLGAMLRPAAPAILAPLGVQVLEALRRPAS